MLLGLQLIRHGMNGETTGGGINAERGPRINRNGESDAIIRRQSGLVEAHAQDEDPVKLSATNSKSRRDDVAHGSSSAAGCGVELVDCCFDLAALVDASSPPSPTKMSPVPVRLNEPAPFEEVNESKARGSAVQPAELKSMGDASRPPSAGDVSERKSNSGKDLTGAVEVDVEAGVERLRPAAERARALLTGVEGVTVCIEAGKASGAVGRGMSPPIERGEALVDETDVAVSGRSALFATRSGVPSLNAIAAGEPTNPPAGRLGVIPNLPATIPLPPSVLVLFCLVGPLELASGVNPAPVTSLFRLLSSPTTSPSAPASRVRSRFLDVDATDAARLRPFSLSSAFELPAKLDEPPDASRARRTGRGVEVRGCEGLAAALTAAVEKGAIWPAAAAEERGVPGEVTRCWVLCGVVGRKREGGAKLEGSLEAIEAVGMDVTEGEMPMSLGASEKAENELANMEDMDDGGSEVGGAETSALGAADSGANGADETPTVPLVLLGDDGTICRCWSCIVGVLYGSPICTVRPTCHPPPSPLLPPVHPAQPAHPAPSRATPL